MLFQRLFKLKYVPLSHLLQYSIKSHVLTPKKTQSFLLWSIVWDDGAQENVNYSTHTAFIPFLLHLFSLALKMYNTSLSWKQKQNNLSLFMNWCLFWNPIRMGGEGKKNNRPISFFIFLLGCFSPLGAAGRNPAIGIVRENTFRETSQFSTVIHQDPREEALVHGGIMS